MYTVEISGSIIINVAIKFCIKKIAYKDSSRIYL